MKHLLFILLIGIPALVNAQDFPSFYSRPLRLADETTYTVGADQLRITSYNDSVAGLIIRHYAPCGCIDVFTKRKGRGDKAYTRYLIILPPAKTEEIVRYFKAY